MKALALSLFLLWSLFRSSSQIQQSPPAFNHVFLSVHNLDSSIAFYTKAFDLKVTNRFNQLEVTQTDTSFTRHLNVAFLKFPGQDLVYELGERTDKSDTTVKPGNLYNHVGVEVKDIAIAFKRAVDAGGKVGTAIRRVKTNGGLTIKQAFIKGPDGESIELVEIITGAY